MSEPAVQDAPVQHTIEMPNGVIVSGSGGDADAIREQLEDRHEERTGQPAPSAATPVTSAEAPSAKRRRVAQERIDEAIGKQREAERQRDALDARLRALEARTPTPIEAPKSPEAPAPRTKPLEEEVGTKYATYADFVEDLADWKAEQKLSSYDAQTRARIDADRASRHFQDAGQQMVDRGRKAYPDFDAVQRNPEGGGFVPLGPTPEIHQAKVQQILSLPNAEHIVYEVCKSKALAQELATIDNPVMFGMRLAHLVATPTPAADAAPVKVSVPMTQAPPPMQPVGTSSRTTLPSLTELASKGTDFDSSGYRERRAAERKANSR